MFSVESMRNVPFLINIIKDGVCILLDSSSENHNLIVFGHFLQKLKTIGANQEGSLFVIFEIVDQSFIHI